MKKEASKKATPNVIFFFILLVLVIFAAVVLFNVFHNALLETIQRVYEESTPGCW